MCMVHKLSFRVSLGLKCVVKPLSCVCVCSLCVGPQTPPEELTPNPEEMRQLTLVGLWKPWIEQKGMKRILQPDVKVLKSSKHVQVMQEAALLRSYPRIKKTFNSKWPNHHRENPLQTKWREKTLLLHLIPPNDCEHFWPLKVRECLRVLCVSSVWGNDSLCLCTNTAQSLQNCRPGLHNPAPLHFNPIQSGFLMAGFYFDPGPSNLVQLQNYERQGWASKQAT